MIAILSLLIETKIPSDLYFNDCGVCMKALRAGSSLGKGYLIKGGRWEVSLISINGIWYGSSRCDYHLGGFSSPITRHHPFKTADDCIEHYFSYVIQFLERSGCKKLPIKPTLKDFEEAYLYR